MELRSRYRAYLACCNERRWGELAEYVHDPVTVDGQATPLAEYVAAIAGVADAFDDYHWRIEHDIIEGERVAVVLDDTGTHTGEWHGIAPTGRAVRIRELASYRFDDGKIAEVWSCGDDLGLAAQLGARLTTCE